MAFVVRSTIVSLDRFPCHVTVNKKLISWSISLNYEYLYELLLYLLANAVILVYANQSSILDRETCILLVLVTSMGTYALSISLQRHHMRNMYISVLGVICTIYEGLRTHGRVYYTWFH